MDKNPQAPELAASGIFVEERMRMMLKIEDLVGSLFKKPSQSIIIAKK